MKLDDLNVLVKIAENLSITEAANQLDISSSVASVALKRVEKSLGAQLFIRNTRQVRLSPEGERYLPICQQILQLMKEGQMAVNEDTQLINGEVRIAMSSEMGRNLMRQLMNNIMAKQDALRLTMHVSDGRVDLYRDRVDVALRAMTKKAITKSNLYGFKICNIPHFVCASPEYLKRHDAPLYPAQLSQHNALLYKLYDMVNDNWDFHKAGEHYRVKMNSDRSVNDGDIVRRWCCDGVGIAKKSVIDVSQDLLTGKLQRIMPDYSIALTEMWLILPSREMISPAIRLIRDELKREISIIRDKLISAQLIQEEEWPS